ncbi:Plasmodium exported protein, unknown function [Plasmodium ovale]|uniref:Uncharacterized protein n=1 Tax=Plasmodium ovale TaxID=36330 RepID=A0A1D3THB2_PLAOA|nr:Plasmodium exported protein, unknown function [Plasmodium ovale]
MATSKKCTNKVKINNRFLTLINIALCALFFLTLKCFNNNNTLRESHYKNGNFYQGLEKNKRVNRRCLAQQSNFFGPEIDMLKDTVVSFLIRSIKKKTNETVELKPEVVEPRYEPSSHGRDNRDHYYSNNAADIRTHDNYDIRDSSNNGRGMPQNYKVSEVMPYYIPSDSREKDRVLQPVYYQSTPLSDNSFNTSLLGYVKHFLLEQQLFASPVLNKMAPLIFLVVVYYVISALISNFRHIIALYFLAKIVKMHYNHNN